MCMRVDNITILNFAYSNRYCLLTTVRRVFASTVKYFAIGNAKKRLRTQLAKKSKITLNLRQRQTVITINVL